MRRIAVAIVSWIVVVGSFQPAEAQLLDIGGSDQPFEINADSLTYESDRDIYVATGNVHLRQGNGTLSADWVSFSNTTQRGVASGNVVITDGKETLYTRFIEFDITNLYGVLFDGRFASSGEQLRLEGEEIAKTGDKTYEFKNAMFTSCRCPAGERDPWAIRAAEAELELESYGTARNTTFEVLGVPVIWLPWMMYPLKTDRQTGFLFPDIGFGGRNGYQVGLPFFWAAREDLNLTLTPRWLSERGWKGDVEIDYLMGQRSAVEVFASFLYDEDIDPNSRDTPYERERWTVFGRHEIHLPLGIEVRTDATFVSDNDYVINFGELRRHRSDRYLESRTFAGRSLGPGDQFGVVASTWFADDLQAPDDRDRDRFMLQRLPNVELSALPAPLRWLSWLVPTTAVQYTYFSGLQSAESKRKTGMVVGDDIFIDTGIDGLPDAREGSGVDPHSDNAAVGGPEMDGFFQEGEPLADSGHRIRMTPRIGAPIRIADVVEFYPEVGWHETFYQTDAQGSTRTGMFIGRADLRTEFSRHFEGGGHHLITPHIGWAMVARDGQSGKPLFVPATAVPQSRIRQLDLDNVVLDPADRKRRFNGLSWGMRHRYFGAAEKEGESRRMLADIELSAQYEFYDHAFTGIILDGQLQPRRGTNTRFNLRFNPETAQVDEVLGELRWRAVSGHSVTASYRYLRKIPQFFEDFRGDDDRFDNFSDNFNRVNQINLSLRIQLTSQWSTFYRVAYSFENSLLLANVGALEYLSVCRCWSVRLEVREDRVRGAQFNIQYSLVGLGGRAVSAGFGDVGFLDGF